MQLQLNASGFHSNKQKKEMINIISSQNEGKDWNLEKETKNSEFINMPLPWSYMSKRFQVFNSIGIETASVSSKSNHVQPFI